MRPKITIAIPEPYLPLDEYCRRTGTTKVTARRLIEYGKLPIKPKGDQKKGLVEVNMVALTVMALSGYEVSLEA
ncbi:MULTISPECIES: regulator [Proteus]|uniref:regulator n=1 Tax=Proteus TaxID=583 RepID=UPI0023491475|nr:regulator [Proteus mirabilis]MDC5895219.1 regulator [Proteus mirabilis]MDC5916353.1 regulator [Proteus mirabilis]MDC5926870.1 regulator [Proteus mirabilis]MDC6011861.1 regulator [Proteus mirabilis]MDC6022431.1 regulator [Proteus mirabilis]